MRIVLTCFCLALVSSACSTTDAPRARTGGTLTGAETAERATRAAQDAKAQDDTGILVASSHRPDAEPPDEQPDTEATPEPTPDSERFEFEIEMREGVAYHADVPITEESFDAVFNDALEQHGEVAVTLRGSPQSRELLGRLARAAVEAGVQRIEIELHDAPGQETTEAVAQEPAGTDAPTTQPTTEPPSTDE